MKALKYILLLVAIVIKVQLLSSQTDDGSSFVDQKGVLRWEGSNDEIFGFGVNYSVPFAHAYRRAQQMGIDPKKAIQQDIYHFARLDFDLYRVHVWDTEISDSLGNLLDNEHLDVFDFMIDEMKKRGMKFVITPIAFWGNGWPEPDTYTPGFSHKYGKEECLINADAIKAQANYLNQFLEHVNPYTGIAYKNDVDIIAFEISNEPHHKESAEEVTKYINTMVKSMRYTGTSKPIFYNMSHSIELVDAYLDADIDGGTFQWYPSGLVSKHALQGNYLNHVDNYTIPFADHPKFKNMAKIVYEFDPADVDGNYMYPAMARSFRSANMQLATHFAYDAMFLAPYNTNYGTHFMNLVYTPQKAISLKVASAVFHKIPRGKHFGDYPKNTQFDDFKVSYEDDLVEFVSSERFFHSNSTQSKPKDISELREVCGYKNSPIVKYNGDGAYFLDNLEPGVWRLEVMPDAHWLNDPYEPISPKRQIAAVSHQMHPMAIYLPDLGECFSIEAVNADNGHRSVSEDSRFSISPGVYLLKAKESTYTNDETAMYKNITIGEYVAPKTNLDTVLIKTNFAKQYSAGVPIELKFKVIAKEKPKVIEVCLRGSFGMSVLKAKKDKEGYYKVQLSDKFVEEGRLNCHIELKLASGWKTFPSGLSGKLDDWDVYNKTAYVLDFVKPNTHIELWEAENDWIKSSAVWNQNISIQPSTDSGKPVLLYKLEPNMGKDNSEHTFKYFFKDKIVGRLKELSSKTKLHINGRTLDGNATIELALIDKDGNAFSRDIKINNLQDEYIVDLKALSRSEMAILPRPFPDFQDLSYESSDDKALDISCVEVIQVKVISSRGKKSNLYLSSIYLK